MPVSPRPVDVPPAAAPAGSAFPTPLPGTSTDARRAVDRSLVRGVAWNGVVKAVAQAATWISTLVVARLLSPDDYGVVGMATLCLGLIQLVTEFGIGMAVSTKKDLSEQQVAELNSVSLLMGVAGMAVICALAPLLGRFFHERRLPAVLAALSVTFLLSSLRSVPYGLLQRELAFKRLAIYDGLQSLGLAALSVLLASLGFGYWTLVIASVGSAFGAAAVAVVRHPVPFRRPDPRRLSRLLSFSGNIVAQRAAWYGYSNADFAVAGKMLGSVALGSYSLAWNLSRATDRVTALVLQVTPPVLAKVQDERAELRRYVVRITEAMALTILPLMFGLALVAPDFVPVALGAKWQAMVFPLQVLSAYAAVNVVFPLFAQVLNVTGHEGFVMRNNFLQLAVMPLAFAAGAYWRGVNGIALAWVLIHPIIALRSARYTLRTLELPASTFVREALAPALSGGLAMTAAVVGARAAWPVHSPSVARLLVEIAAGALAYCGTLLLLHRRRLTDLQASLRQLLSARGG